MNENDINIVITDREGVIHDVIAPTDMSINLMELIKIHELENDGTIGICGGVVRPDRMPMRLGGMPMRLGSRLRRQRDSMFCFAPPEDTWSAA